MLFGHLSGSQPLETSSRPLSSSSAVRVGLNGCAATQNPLAKRFVSVSELSGSEFGWDVGCVSLALAPRRPEERVRLARVPAGQRDFFVCCEAHVILKNL